MGISLNPDTFTKGGLIQDVDVEIIGGSYTLEPPEGYTQRDRVFAELELKVLDTGEEATQYWSVGRNTDFSPSADGDELVPTGSRSALNDNSNFSIFMQNLANCGFPKGQLTDKLSCIFGTQIHVVRIPGPERAGLEGKKEGDRKQTILVPNKLIKLAGEKAKRGGKKAAAAPTTKESEGESGGDADSLALLAVTEIMSEGKALAIPMLKAAVLRKHLKTEAGLRNQIVALAGDAEWLTTQGMTITNGVVQPS
jgi:hypothetical protein